MKAKLAILFLMLTSYCIGAIPKRNNLFEQLQFLRGEAVGMYAIAPAEARPVLCQAIRHGKQMAETMHSTFTDPDLTETEAACELN